MSLTVKYFDVPNGAQAAAQVTGQGQPFSDPACAASGAEDIAFATLEPGAWTLDGTRNILADSPGGFWWSAERSDDVGVFAVVPVLDFAFPEPYTATGLTFTFWPSMGQWCSRVRVCWYNGNSLLTQAEAYPDSAVWTLSRKVESFDRVRVELLATNLPGQFAKVQRVEIGQTVVFGRGELVSAQLVNEIDPTLCSLTVDTMKISVRDRQDRALAPQEKQRMELYRDETLLAVHYITESVREAQHFYTFSCQSAIGLLDEDFMGGIYTGAPAENIIADIMDGREYVLDAAFAGRTVTGYLPVCTRREALQQLAFALGAVVTTQGSSAISLVPLPQQITGSFSAKYIFPGAKVETAARVARIEVTAHSYTPSATQEILLDNETLSGEDLLLTFDAPHHSYAITGGTITASGANYVTVTANGTVTLTGKTYLHSTVTHTKRNPAATAAERSNVLAVDSVTLVNAGNVSAALARLYDAMQLRQTLTQTAVISGQQAGQRVSTVNPWGTQVRGYISSMDSALTQNGQTADVTIIGAEVSAEAVSGYAGEIYAGDKEVLY